MAACTGGARGLLTGWEPCRAGFGFFRGSPYLCTTRKRGHQKVPSFVSVTMGNREQIEEWLRPKMEELGCFLVDIRINPAASKFEVFIDTPSGVTIEQCEKVSRYLSFMMENSGAFPEKYALDVSSPGMENPLKVQQQFDKNIGKHVEVLLLNGVKTEGLLRKADGHVLHLEVHHPPKKKGMAPETELFTYDFADIKYVKKKIQF